MCDCKHGLTIEECSDCGATSPTTLSDDGRRMPRQPNGIRRTTYISHELADYLGLGVCLETVQAVYRFTRDDSLRLELLGSALISGGSWSDVKRDYLGRLRDRLGFGGCSLSTVRRASALVDNDCDLMRVVVAIADDERAKEDQTIVAEVVALLGLLGEALLQTGSTVGECAKVCGMSERTAYRRLDQVRQLFLAKFNSI